MKNIKTISILTVCLVASLLFGAELVPGEMSLSQASETFGSNECPCVYGNGPSCPTPCSGSGSYWEVIGTKTGAVSCYSEGEGACGDCELPDEMNCEGSCDG